MAAVKQQINQFERLLIGIIQDTLISNKAVKAFGKAAIDLIVARTRRGYGVVKTGANANRLKSLSTSYVEFRKRSKLDSTTSPGKSNLTFSGQLLRSLIVETKQGGSFTIRANDRKRKNGPTNNELAQIVADNGRPFLGLTGSEIKQLSQLYETGLAAALKKQL